ncbi:MULTISPECIES: hypothetical protein [Larsenimonas]|uniref:Uncharacterized protein n=1 Tax=Larsenimonas suaedae TaxID=1851019 RepID=A0ABU1GVA0_9GAMM|nr:MULTISPECIES: hypothetical protein [Larsenimonas]MCM2971736.1 hypothetical protein [Larsenimonas suaedae]MCM5703841.1 hypothetical protein [Larsenimonas salina]MDR5895288.1 hypothetical protein [Larsenimonas suaedae]
MNDLSEEMRMPSPCPECGSHRVRLSQVHNPEDKVFCSSCNTQRGLYSDLKRELIESPKSTKEALIEEAANKKS